METILLILLLGIGVETMAATDCPSKKFWNGTSCNPCSGCPLGSGVKTSCSAKKDTECQSCWLGFDFSNTTGMEACMPCSLYSNCLDGNAKIIANCTLVSPPVCQGCADNFFFDLWSGENGGCNKCSPPCGHYEVEAKKCTTAHDRQCIKQRKTEKVVVPITVPNVKTTAAEESPSGTDGDIAGTEQLLPEPNPKRGQTSKEGSFMKNNWHWVVISVTIPSVLGISLGISVLVRRKRRKKRNSENNPSVLERAVDQPLLPLHGGLDTLVRDLSIEDRRFITQELNGKYHDGYYYWRIVAEKLSLKDASRDWERAENPAEKLLSAYGEKDGSNVRNLIKALKEAKLTLLAEQLEKKFNKTNEQEKGEELEITATWV